MNKLIPKWFAFSLCLLSFPALSQTDLAGDWYGTLEVDGGILSGGATLNLIFHIAESEDGYTTLLETPAFGSFSSAETIVDENSLIFRVEEFQIEYLATFSGTLISGTFTQEGQTVPNFTLRRIE